VPYRDPAVTLRLLLVLAAAVVLAALACDAVVDDTVEEVPAGEPDDDDTVPPDDAVPAECLALAVAMTVGDGSDLAGTPDTTLAARPLRALVVTPAEEDASFGRRLRVQLDGLGWPADRVYDTDLADSDLATYGALFLVSSPWDEIALDDGDAERIGEAVGDGCAAMWIGPGFDPDLAGLFGVQVVDEASVVEAGVNAIAYTDAAGADMELSLVDGFVSWVEADGAEVLATLEPAGIPALTAVRGAPGEGPAVLAPFELLEYWGEDPEDHGWGRAELLTEAIRGPLTAGGAAFLEPWPDGHGSPFLVRYEDINPMGTRYMYTDEFAYRLEHSVMLLHSRGAAVHLGVVARFVDPTYGEDHDWHTPDETRERVRQAVQWSLDQGAHLICHGWTHQYGEGDTDYTGIDWEFSDDATGTWEFLPYAEQLERIEAGRAELTEAFGIEPQIWETPHLDGNEDTYQAAADAGFALINESDETLFPNRWGRDDAIGGAALNLPHTGSYMPDDEELTAWGEVTLQWTMPRMARINSPYFFFYHGFSDEQVEVLREIADCAMIAQMWRPDLLELADWWQQREDAVFTPERVDGATLRATVEDHPAGTTLTFRLPDGVPAGEVTVDGTPVEATTHHRLGVAYAQVVLAEAGDATIVEIGDPVAD